MQPGKQSLGIQPEAQGAAQNGPCVPPAPSVTEVDIWFLSRVATSELHFLGPLVGIQVVSPSVQVKLVQTGHDLISVQWKQGFVG